MKRAEYCGRAVWEMLYHDYPTFRLLLTADEQSDPNSIDVERKKALCLKFLRDNRYIKKDLDLILFEPRKTFSGIDAKEEELDAFYEDIVAVLNLNKPRYDAQLAEFEKGVSCQVCILHDCMNDCSHPLLLASHSACNTRRSS